MVLVHAEKGQYHKVCSHQAAAGNPPGWITRHRRWPV